MIVSLYQQVDSYLLGHVDLSKPKPVWNTLSIFPTGLTNDETTGKMLLSVVGKGSGLSFTVQIGEGASEIALDQPHTVNVQGDEVSVFQFITPQGISDKQLDITATSQSKVAAYLKVSQNFKEVDLQKDLESINYRKESLRLSFATKGRITLSSVSIPPLTDSISRWFIGIGLKNLSGDVKLSESKDVTLKLTRSFDYNYARPICVLFFVSLVIGILVSIFAYFLFEESLTQAKPGEGNQVNNIANLKVLVCEMWKEIRCQRFSSDPDTYSYITSIMGAVFMVSAFWSVLANWHMMIREGDRDNCYYNEFCYRVANHDIPLNLMISNLTYIVHGLILAVWVLILDVRSAIDKECLKNRHSLSIGYAFSWAFVFQGLFSALYHLCPCRSTFQFDSVFMFIIAGLIVLLLYDNRFPSSGDVKHPVGASKFFTFFISPLLMFNCLGVLFNSASGLDKVMQRFFFGSLILWWIVIVLWTASKLGIPQKICSDNPKDKFEALTFILVFVLNPLVICMVYFNDLANAFLNVCIVISGIAILIRAWPSWKKLSKCIWKCAYCDYDKGTLQVLFIIFTLFLLVAAVLVFKSLPTTNKTSSPENSRDTNEECVILGFFDWHDLWHFLSSFVLLMGAFVLMFMSSEPEQSPQAEIREKNKSDAQKPEGRAERVKTRGNNKPETQGKKRA